LGDIIVVIPIQPRGEIERKKMNIITSANDDGYFTVNAMWFKIIKPKPLTTDNTEEK
jgi:hypothetical protein